MKCRYFCRLPLDISPVYLTRGISKDLVSVLFVFSHYLIMGGFFCITEKTFIPALQATGQCSQNVPPAGYLHQPVAGSCF